MAFYNWIFFNTWKNYDFKKNETAEWWNLISKNEKESIELGLKDAAAGMLNPHSKARELYKKWLWN
jgi:hypothetical protein